MRKRTWAAAAAVIILMVMAVTAVRNLRQVLEVPMAALMLGYVVGAASAFNAAVDWMKPDREDINHERHV